MAVSAVYVRISQIDRGGRPLSDPVTFSNISSTTAAFHLPAGKYAIEVVGATFGTVTLQVLAGDGTTYVTALTAFSANGHVSADLGSGTYKIALA